MNLFKKIIKSDQMNIKKKYYQNTKRFIQPETLDMFIFLNISIRYTQMYQRQHIILLWRRI